MSNYNQRAFIQNEVILRWLDFKEIIDSKSLFVQYAEAIDQYQIFAFDGVIGYLTSLYKPGYSAQVRYDPDYSQLQNDLDYVDFTTNYLDDANQIISTNSRQVSGIIENLGDIVYVSSRGSGNVGVQVSGTWVGSLEFQGTIDNVNWENVFAYPVDTANAGVSSISTNGGWRILGGGLSGIRLRSTAFVSGTAYVIFEATGATSTVRSVQGAPVGNLSNAWPVKVTDGNNILGTSSNPFVIDPAGITLQPIYGAIEITDGYNGAAAIKGPSTAAVASDPALVVAISPNNPITVTDARPSINNTSSVAASTSNVLLLAPNSIRLGATIYNDSSSLLYVKLGPVASISDFTIKLFPLCYYEVPYGYTGEIDGIWASPSGSAKVGELTP